MTKFRNKIKKILAITTIATLLLFNMVPAYAYDVPSAPSSPTVPSSPDAPTSPDAPPAPDAPTSPTSDTPQDDSTEYADSESDGSGSGEWNDESNSNSSDETTPAPSVNGSPIQTQDSSGTVDNGNLSADGQTSDPSITTGDATNDANILATGNLNTSGVGTGGGGSVTVVNDGNGSGSDNNGSVALVDNNQTIQDNTANVLNDLDQSANTGDNSTSGNVGNSSITTGSANVSGTIITAVNTNVAGMAVAEFTVADDYTGDIILDFTSACTVGCAAGSTTVENSDNGSNSQNTAEVTQITNNDTFQNNDATITNSMTLDANSGDNTASENTGGDSAITTGDANVAANSLTFANNNIAGNVVFGVVNIFGDLMGDIILTEEALAAICGSCATDIAVANTGNGSDSTNTASVDQTTNNIAFQTNDTTITNNLVLDATTGDNATSKNTGGDSSIKTGEATIDAQVFNIANANLYGGTWWLVIVNEAGQWIGRILGSPDGSYFAGSAGTEFVVGPNGEVTATNSNNGSGSTNTASVDQTVNNTTVQNNTANIVNNLNLSANTGDNKASENTGGNSSITTGDANIIANLVNFVNNNISGNGRLVVTVVNVFGSWFGDFIGPGQTKQQSTAQNTSDNTNQGGVGGLPGNQGSNNNGNSSTTQAGTSNDADNNGVAGVTDTAVGSVFGGIIQGSQSQNSGLYSPLIAAISQHETAESQDSQIAATTRKKIKINLAFVLLLLPFAVVFMIGRRVIVHKMRSSNSGGFRT